MTEDLGRAFDGEGPHACFLVEKTDTNTLDVAHALAAATGVPRHEVGYAGRKDRHGITQQWFSAPTACDRWPVDLPGVSCHAVARHGRKLRIGSHRGNFFEITLRSTAAEQPAVLQALRTTRLGFANRFGPQRTAGDNWQQAVSWLSRPHQQRRRTGAGRRGWHLSVLRSGLFNAVVTHRHALVAPGQVLDGDMLVSGQPSGPLWGRGRSPVRAAAAVLERDALAPHRELCDAMEYTGLAQARRPLVVKPRDLSVEAVDTTTLRLRCWLPPGSYATALLADRLTIEDASRTAP